MSIDKHVPAPQRRRRSPSRRRVVSATATLSAVVFIATACSTGISFSPEELDIDACEQGTYYVEEMAAEERPSCDVGGMDIIFPDGYTMAAPQGIGIAESNVSTSPKEYFAANNGIYGIAAAMRDGDGQVIWYGNPAAIERWQEKHGRDF